VTDQVFVDTWGWLAAANSRDQHHPGDADFARVGLGLELLPEG